MSIQTAWVKPPNQIGGLDHLAVQAPCINIYGRLLPGITNVTDRARYYSFYPWIIWALEQEGYRYNSAFIDQFRRADCLFTLIAHRHAHVTGSNYDDHAGAMVGSANMAGLMADIKANKAVRLSDVAHRGEEGKIRYFKNVLGGLGQYYLGVFSELGIMDGTSTTGVKNTNQVGRVLAESMDKGVDRQLFLNSLAEDTVTVERLDQLASFCPCQLTGSIQEHRLLADAFFVQGLFDETDMMPRRRTLQAILYLTDDLANMGESIGLGMFRGCVYSGALPNGSAWILPEHLQQNRRRWAVYQRNELLSVAVQGIFFSLLDAYEASGHRFESIEQLCRWFLTSSEVDFLSGTMQLEARVNDLVEGAGGWLPSLNNWADKDHEVQLANQVELYCGSKERSELRGQILQSSLKTLLALMCREETKEGYDDLVFPGAYFQVYPINLRSFLAHSANTWSQQSVREWVFWLCNHWGVQTHFMVALRKLRGQSQSTFRIRPSDQGLEVILAPTAVFTSPRFNQSLRILKDIGALVKEGESWQTSELGKKLKEVGHE